MNRVILTGRICNEPELAASGSGTEYCNVTLACDRAYKNKEGVRETDFIPLSVWGKTAAFVNKYFHKGDGMTVEGTFESRNYTDKEGKKRTAYSVHVESVEFPPGKGKGSTDGTISNEFTELTEGEGSSEPLPF